MILISNQLREFDYSNLNNINIQLKFLKLHMKFS